MNVTEQEKLDNQLQEQVDTVFAILLISVASLIGVGIGFGLAAIFS